ncbi:MAG: hypothetical protein A2V88_17730 [Elusimicrobia bacterium RBG_16_66_12]|nr:MAG: hypothetical protein A2V88_17730 [Elusimicrobia bacterium RBG_16_66_12]
MATIAGHTGTQTQSGTCEFAVEMHVAGTRQSSLGGTPVVDGELVQALVHRAYYYASGGYWKFEATQEWLNGVGGFGEDSIYAATYTSPLEAATLWTAIQSAGTASMWASVGGVVAAQSAYPTGAPLEAGLDGHWGGLRSNFAWVDPPMDGRIPKPSRYREFSGTTLTMDSPTYNAAWEGVTAFDRGQCYAIGRDGMDVPVAVLRGLSASDMYASRMIDATRWTVPTPMFRTHYHRDMWDAANNEPDRVATAAIVPLWGAGWRIYVATVTGSLLYCDVEGCPDGYMPTASATVGTYEGTVATGYPGLGPGTWATLTGSILGPIVAAGTYMDGQHWLLTRGAWTPWWGINDRTAWSVEQFPDALAPLQFYVIDRDPVWLRHRGTLAGGPDWSVGQDSHQLVANGIRTADMRQWSGTSPSWPSWNLRMVYAGAGGPPTLVLGTTQGVPATGVIAFELWDGTAYKMVDWRVDPYTGLEYQKTYRRTCWDPFAWTYSRGWYVGLPQGWALDEAHGFYLDQVGVMCTERMQLDVDYNGTARYAWPPHPWELP